VSDNRKDSGQPAQIRGDDFGKPLRPVVFLNKKRDHSELCAPEKEEGDTWGSKKLGPIRETKSARRRQKRASLDSEFLHASSPARDVGGVSDGPQLR